MRILFISHSYPPIVGGVESQNYNLGVGLGKVSKTTIIANSRGKFWLPVFLPMTLLRAAFLMKNQDICLLGNGVLAPLGWFLKIFFPSKKFFCVVHGLDITFASRKERLSAIYRLVNIPSLKKLTHLFMVGNATIEEAGKVGIAQEHCTFIPNGVNPDKLIKHHERKELTKLFGKNVSNKKVLLRLGRFVPHKGTSWFIRNIMPKLPNDVVLIAAGNRVSSKTVGDKDDFLQCEQAIIDCHLNDRVRLLPSLPWKDVLTLLNTVDLVVSPNVKIPGTMEGFGINVIEAGACGRIVLASNLEGLADAIVDGQNGFLVEPENENRWLAKITALLATDENFKKMFGIRTTNFIREHLTWKKICGKYLEEMGKY